MRDRSIAIAVLVGIGATFALAARVPAPTASASTYTSCTNTQLYTKYVGLNGYARAWIDSKTQPQKEKLLCYAPASSYGPFLFDPTINADFTAPQTTQEKVTGCHHDSVSDRVKDIVGGTEGRDHISIHWCNSGAGRITAWPDVHMWISDGPGMFWSFDGDCRSTGWKSWNGIAHGSFVASYLTAWSYNPPGLPGLEHHVLPIRIIVYGLHGRDHKNTNLAQFCTPK